MRRLGKWFGVLLLSAVVTGMTVWGMGALYYSPLPTLLRGLLATTFGLATAGAFLGLCEADWRSGPCSMRGSVCGGGAPSFSLTGFELPSPGLGKHALLVDALLGVYSVLVSVAIQARYAPPVP
jgi:hypothetical protein